MPYKDKDVDRVKKNERYLKARAKENIEERELRLKKTREYNREAYKRFRMAVLEKYSEGIPLCRCCGETFLGFLTIDHKLGGGRKERDKVKGGNLQYYKYLLREEVDHNKYQILCYNCNCYKRADMEKKCHQ